MLQASSVRCNSCRHPLTVLHALAIHPDFMALRIRRFRPSPNLANAMGPCRKDKCMTTSTPSHLQTCIQACLACSAACNQCFAACLKEQDLKSMAACMALDVDCAQACEFAASAMLRGQHASQRNLPHVRGGVQGMCTGMRQACASPSLPSLCTDLHHMRQRV